MTCARRRTEGLAAAALVLSMAAVLLTSSPASALICAFDWGDDTFGGAKQAVAQSGRWDGLLVGTIGAVERRDDHWRTRVLVVEPDVVFVGDLRHTVRAAIGGHGPEMSVGEGATYFLGLTWDAATESWFVAPCAPNMRMTSPDQLAQLRAISDHEVVISEPVIPVESAPVVVWVGAALVAAALAGTWVVRRVRAMVPVAR